MSRRTRSRVRRHTSKVVDQLCQARSGRSWSFRRTGSDSATSRTKVLLRMRGKERMHVGETIGHLPRRELPFEVLLLQAVVQIFQGIERGPEAVQIGPAIGACRASGSVRGRCRAWPGSGRRRAAGSGSRSARSVMRALPLSTTSMSGLTAFDDGPRLGQGQHDLGGAAAARRSGRRRSIPARPRRPRCCGPGAPPRSGTRCCRRRSARGRLGRPGCLAFSSMVFSQARLGQPPGVVDGRGLDDVVEAGHDLFFLGDRASRHRLTSDRSRSGRGDDDDGHRLAPAVAQVHALVPANSQKLAGHVLQFITTFDANFAHGWRSGFWGGRDSRRRPW